MSWFKIDDSLHQNKKVRELTNAALGLWTRCGSFCAQQSNGGLIPRRIALLYGSKRQIQALVDAGLWVPVDDKGWQMHHWDHYNPTAEQAKAQREANAERVRKHRAVMRDNSVTSRVTRGVTYGVSNAPPSRTTSSSTDTPVDAREAANARSMAAGLALTGSKPEDAYREAIQSYPRQERAIRDELGLR